MKEKGALITLLEELSELREQILRQDAGLKTGSTKSARFIAKVRAISPTTLLCADMTSGTCRSDSRLMGCRRWEKRRPMCLPQ